MNAIKEMSLEETLDKIKTWSKDFREFLWRLAELHLHRLILILIIWLCTWHYSILNFILVLLSVATLFLPQIQRVMIGIMGILIFFFFVIQFPGTYSNGLDPNLWFNLRHNCSNEPNEFNYSKYKTEESIKKWAGFERILTNHYNWEEIFFQIIIVMFIGIYFTVYFRQSKHRQKYKIEEPPKGILFPDDMDGYKFDKDLLSCFKVGCNYFFYKFGLEICLIFMVFVAWFRMDALAVVLLALVTIIVFLNRRSVRVMWPILVIYLLIEMPAQYLKEMGLAYKFCFDYPWSRLVTTEISKAAHYENTNLLEFMDIPNYGSDRRLGDPRLIADYILLMLVVAQWGVFRTESKRHPAGSNTTIYKDGKYTLRKDNPHHDFIVEKRSFVDYIKTWVFMHGHWLTLISVLIAGLGGQSLFSLIYLVIGFWMLWQGNNLYAMKNHKATLTKWYIVCACNLMVMLWKTSLQFIGCVLIPRHTKINPNLLCVIRQLFSIVCATTASHKRVEEIENEDDSHGKCGLNERDTMIGLDLLAFAFIIFQLRILNSYFFQRCIVEIKCEVVQASRGAILINQLVEKQMTEQTNQQKHRFREIKQRMALIRRTCNEEHARSKTGYHVAESYAQARLAGDYHMFEYDPHKGYNLNEAKEHYVEEVEPGTSENNKLNPPQLVHTALIRHTDLDETLDAIKSAENHKNNEKRMIEAVRIKQPSTSQENDSNSDYEEIRPIDENQTEDEDDERAPSIRVSIHSSSDVDEKSKVEKVFNALRFVWKIITSCLHYCSAFFNRHSREQRYVGFVLDQEKIRLKSIMEENLYAANQSTKDLRIEWEAQGLHLVSSTNDIARLEEEVQGRWEQHSILTKFLNAFISFISSYTHVLCYIMACIVQGLGGGLITLPLPFMVLFWATLSSPRPPRIFWIAMITYTEFLILLKFIFQFKFLVDALNGKITNKFGEKNVLLSNMLYTIGIKEESLFALPEVILLVFLFIHRQMLRKFGLWKDANADKTFEEAIGSRRTSAAGLSNNVNMAPDTQSIMTTNQTESDFDKQRNGFSLFYYNLKNPKLFYVRDLYPAMFFLDIVCLCILVIGYQGFGEASSNSNLITSSKIPILLVVIIFILVLMMIIDRALYLCKKVQWKLYYQLAIIVVLHIWIIIVLPIVTGKAAALNKAAKGFYIVKCLYLIVSAWQIRNGYPRLCIGHLLTRSYTIVNYIVFMIYMNLPLMFEIRTVVDWTYTQTCMPLFDFLKMEVFYSRIFMVKCSREIDKAFPSPSGEPKPALVKYLLGLPIILGIILFAMFPLLLFALLNHIGDHTPIQSFDMTVSLEGYPPFYTMNAQGVDLLRGTEENKTRLLAMFESNEMGNTMLKKRVARSFIKDYKPEDFYIVKFRPHANDFWSISNASLESMKKDLSLKKSDKTNVDNKHTLNIHLELVRDRPSAADEPIIQSFNYKINFDFESDLANEMLKALEVNPNEKGSSFKIPFSLPYYLAAPNEGRLDVPDGINRAMLYVTEKDGVKSEEPSPNTTYTHLIMSMNLNNNNQRLWTIQPEIYKNNTNFEFKLTNINYGPDRDLKYIPVVLFIDRAFPAFLGAIIKGGSVIAIYTTFVLVFARLFRTILVSSPLEVILDELPNPDYVLEICLDIYLVREARDFLLEQDLFAKLLFLFRSPETLIKWTRPKYE